MNIQLKINSLALATLVLLLLSAQSLRAQQSGKTKSGPTTYILPDGRAIGEDKLDSIRKAWGADKVVMRHNDDDDAKRIIHLDQLTDKLQKELAAGSANQLKTLTDMIGQPAIDFTATDLQGRKVQLSKLKGKVVVVNFWFANCPPCIAEMPDLNQLVKEFAQGDVVFLAVTFDNENKVKSFLKEHAFNYQLLPNAKATINAYGINNYPSHLVIGKDGRLKKYFITGEHIKTSLEEAIRDQNS